MNAIKKNFWQSKESGRLLMEVTLFAVQIIAVIFLLNLSIGRYSGDAETKTSDLTASPNQQKMLIRKEHVGQRDTRESDSYTFEFVKITQGKLCVERADYFRCCPCDGGVECVHSA